MSDDDARKAYPSEQAERFIVRMPEGMRNRLRDAAAVNNRSMNSEIVSRLERYDSLGGEADAAIEVARTIATEVDKLVDPTLYETPLTDEIGDVLADVGEDGSVNRARIARRFAALTRALLTGSQDRDPVETIWRRKYPDIELRDSDISQLRDEFGMLMDEYRESMRQTDAHISAQIFKQWIDRITAAKDDTERADLLRQANEAAEAHLSERRGQHK